VKANLTIRATGTPAPEALERDRPDLRPELAPPMPQAPQRWF
jgi:hypothetical protein